MFQFEPYFLIHKKKTKNIYIVINIFRKKYFNSATNKFHKPGTIVKPSEAFCNTLTIIAEKGGDELYNGTLAVEFLEDLNRVGSIITAEDLKNYE